jgi:hypothetical protein
MSLLLTPIAIAAVLGGRDAWHLVALPGVLFIVWLVWSLGPIIADSDGARLCRRDQPQQLGTSGSHGFFRRLGHFVDAAAGRGRHSRVPVQCTVSALLAGIVLVDMLAVQGGGGWMPLAFLALFASALILQRTIPAT